MDPQAFVMMAMTSERSLGPGCVMVDPARCEAKYVAIGEVQPPEMQTNLREQLANHPENIYVVNRTEKHLHVFAYPRAAAVQRAAAGALPRLEGPPDDE